MSIGYVTKPFPSNEYNFLAPTEEDFRSSETSNVGRALLGSSFTKRKGYPSDNPFSL